MGCHHGDIAGWLLEKWALPPMLVTQIVDHHDFRPQRDHAARTVMERMDSELRDLKRM